MSVLVTMHKLHYTVRHGTVLIISPLVLQTIVTAQMLPVVSVKFQAELLAPFY